MRLIFLALIALPSLLYSQRRELEVASLNDKKILTDLFDSKTLDSSFVIWKPNFAEAQEFNISYDGMCHTMLDTIFYYSSAGWQYGLLLFTTYGVYEEEGLFGCHVCAPDLSIAIFNRKSSKETWRFQQMQKHLTRFGAFGVRADARLLQYAEDMYGLELEGGSTGQGYTEVLRVLYDLEYFAEIFRTITHEDNEGAAESDDMTFSWDKTIIFDTKHLIADRYIIVTQSNGTVLSSDGRSTPRSMSNNHKEIFYFDEVMGRYVPKR